MEDFTLEFKIDENKSSILKTYRGTLLPEKFAGESPEILEIYI